MKSAVLTPEFRLSFPSLFKARPDMNGKVGFRMEMLFPKNILQIAPEEMAALRKLYNETVPAEWRNNGQEFRSFNAAFINGDKKKQPERKGHFILKASASEQYPPRLFDENFNPATPAQLYAGCFAKAVLTCYSYSATNEKGVVINRGVAFNIKDVRKTRDGDPFGGAISDAEADALWGREMKSDEMEDMLGD